MILRIIFIFFFIVATSFYIPVAFGQIRTCEEATSFILNRSYTVSFRQITRMKEVSSFILSESKAQSTLCAEHIIERALFEYGDLMERYSQSFERNSVPEKEWAEKAASAYLQYIFWWLDLDEDRQFSLIKSYLRIPNDVTPRNWNKRKDKWIRQRIGNAVNSLASCFVRAGKKDMVFSCYEKISFRSTEVFPVEAVSEWYKWLLSQPEFIREKNDHEIEELLSVDLTVRQRWAAFATFRSQYIVTNPNRKGEWLLPKGLGEI